jgi:PAS domain S-box-containing protein
MANMKQRLNLQGNLIADWPTFAAPLILLYIAWVWLTPSARILGPASALMVFGIRVAAAFTILNATRSIKTPEVWRAWRFLGTAFALWATADALEVVSWVLLRVPLPMPSIADLLRLAGHLAALSALAAYPASPPERFGRTRELLDMVILTMSVLTLVWFVFLRSIIDIGLGGSTQIFWTAVGPISDMILLTFSLRLFMLSSSEREMRTFRTIGLVALILMLSDLADSYLAIEAEQAGGRFVEAGWMISSVLIALASRDRTSPVVDESVSGSEAQRRRWGPRLEPLLPIAFTYAVVGFTATDWWLSGEVDWLGIAAAGLLSLALVARQGVIAGQFEMRQFAALVNATADLAFICEADGLLRLANPALYEALGVSATSEDDLLLGEFLTEQDDLEDILSQALTGEWIGEVTFSREDETTFPVSLSLRLVRDAGQGRVLLAATAHDLTIIRERENALRSALDDVAAARQELETLNVELEGKVEARTSELEATIADLARLNEELKELDRLKSEFVALVSHELRSPLTNIRIGIELILKNYPDLKPSVNESLDLVQSETRRLVGFVETLLNLSALEAGKFPLQTLPTPLESVAERVLSRFPQDSETDRLRIEFPDDLPLVRADEHALESVFFHLIDNALKYATEGEVKVETWLEGSEVFVAVDDAGPGIPRQEREQVFDMFHRLDASDAREIYGYGLGLPMVQRLLNAMQGGVRIEESPDGGARLVFWLPQAD